MHTLRETRRPAATPAPLHRLAPLWSGLLGAGLLAACATQPTATNALAASATAVEVVRYAGEPEYAAAELNAERTKLERARLLAQAGRNLEAIRMAEEADADAQLARAKAAAERSRRAADEVNAGLRTLREEMARQSGGTTPGTSPGTSPSTSHGMSPSPSPSTSPGSGMPGTAPPRPPQ